MKSAVCTSLVIFAFSMQLCALNPARSQSADKMPRIGFLSVDDGAAPTTIRSGFREGMKELGYVDGQNMHVEYRWGNGRYDRLPELAAELVGLKVDVIVAVVTTAALAAKAATGTIPIVMIGVADPVGVKLVASLAKPGGNVTGTSTLQASMVAKQFQLIRELAPALTRIAVLWSPANARFQMLALEEAQVAAQTAGVSLQVLAAGTPNEIEAATIAIAQDGTRAVLILADPAFTRYRHLLMEAATSHRLITVCGHRDYAEAGCLISYGPSYYTASKRAAIYVTRILDGALPAELPIEQPTQFETVANLKTAKSLGLALPSALLARADEVIE